LPVYRKAAVFSCSGRPEFTRRGGSRPDGINIISEILPMMGLGNPICDDLVFQTTSELTLDKSRGWGSAGWRNQHLQYLASNENIQSYPW